MFVKQTKEQHASSKKNIYVVIMNKLLTKIFG